MTDPAHIIDDIAAARAAIDAHRTRMDLETGHPTDVNLWHLLASLLILCKAEGIDFDALLRDVREEALI